MQTYVQSRWLPATPARAWRLLSEVERWPEWCPTMDAVSLLDHPMAAGARARIVQPGLRPATWVVERWEPPHRFSWSTRHPGIRVTADHVVVADGSGVTVTLSLAYDGLLARWMGGFLKRKSHDYMVRELAALETELGGLAVMVSEGLLDLGSAADA